MNIDYGVFLCVCVCWLWRFIQFNPIFRRQFATNSYEQREKKVFQRKSLITSTVGAIFVQYI